MSSNAPNLPDDDALLAEIKNQPVTVLDIPVRIRRVLVKNNIYTIGDFLELQAARNYLRGIGDNSLRIIEASLNDFFTHSLGRPGEGVESEPENQRPLLFDQNAKERPDLVELIFRFVKAALKKERHIQIIKLSYGLGGEAPQSLQEVGTAYQISQERVRQINNSVLKRVRVALFGATSSKKYHIPRCFFTEARELFELLKRRGALLTNEEVQEIVEARYRRPLDQNRTNALRFLLLVFGFRELPGQPGNYSRRYLSGWQTKKTFRIERVWEISELLPELLEDSVTSLSFSELKRLLEREYGENVSNRYLSYALKISLDIVSTGKGGNRLKLASPPPLLHQAYRVLSQHGRPMHRKEILRSINLLRKKGGHPAHTKIDSLTSQLTKDPRFESIGRSGKWVLAEWDHISTKPIITVMKEFFHRKKRRATLDEIYNYVIARRPDVRKNSVRAYLYSKEIFVRVAPAEYGLSTWGAPPYKPPTLQKQLVPAIHAIFAARQSSEMPLSELVGQLVERTGLKKSSVYGWLRQSPIVETVPLPANRRYKLAKYTGVVKKKPDKKKETLLEKVQTEVARYLQEQPGCQAPLADAAAHVMVATGCKRQTFYTYVSKMKSVKKKNINGRRYCYLIS